jgi:hypothetical protein
MEAARLAWKGTGSAQSGQSLKWFEIQAFPASYAWSMLEVGTEINMSRIIKGSLQERSLTRTKTRRKRFEGLCERQL